MKNQWPVDLWPRTENVGLRSRLESIFCPSEVHRVQSATSHHPFFIFPAHLCSRYQEQLVMCLSVWRTVSLQSGSFQFKYVHVLITEGCFIWIYVEQIVSLLCKAHLHPPLHKRVLKCAGWVQTAPHKLTGHHTFIFPFSTFPFYLWPHSHLWRKYNSQKCSKTFIPYYCSASDVFSPPFAAVCKFSSAKFRRSVPAFSGCLADRDYRIVLILLWLKLLNGMWETKPRFLLYIPHGLHFAKPLAEIIIVWTVLVFLLL